MSNRRLAELAGLVHRSTTQEPTVLNESRLLLEEEDEGGDDDAGGIDLFGDDAGDDDKADDAGGDDAADDDKDDTDKEDEEKEEDEKAKPEKPAETLKTKDIAKYGPGEIDKEIDSVITNIFSDSTMRAKVQSQTSLGYPGASELEESFKSSMKNKSLDFLMEESDVPSYEQIDISHFTSEVARYINNYENLLDIEGMLFNKARQFLLNQIGKEAEQEFVELLATRFGLDFKQDFTDTSPAFTPTAVGATGGSGA